MQPGETAVMVTEEIAPVGETAVMITEETIPQGETPVLISKETTFSPFENGREFEKTSDTTTTTTTTATTTTTTTSTHPTTTTNDCCPQYSHRGSPDCYEYCELADQLAALMEMLASLTGRTRHRRSQANEMEELVINNLYTA